MKNIKIADKKCSYWLVSVWIYAILHSRQQTIYLHDLWLEILTEHGKELRLFGAKACPLLKMLMSHIWHISSSNVFSYDVVVAEL